jgi:hypothetical protein
MSFGIRLSSNTGSLQLDGLNRPLAQIAKYVIYEGGCPPIYLPGLSAKVADGSAVVFNYIRGTGRRGLAASPAEATADLFISEDTVQGRYSEYMNFVIIIYL